jgi:hypothetical protein
MSTGPALTTAAPRRRRFQLSFRTLLVLITLQVLLLGGSVFGVWLGAQRRLARPAVDPAGLSQAGGTDPEVAGDAEKLAIGEPALLPSGGRTTPLPSETLSPGSRADTLDETSELPDGPAIPTAFNEAPATPASTNQGLDNSQDAAVIAAEAKTRSVHYRGLRRRARAQSAGDTDSRLNGSVAKQSGL